MFNFIRNEKGNNDFHLHKLIPKSLQILSARIWKKNKGGITTEDAMLLIKQRDLSFFSSYNKYLWHEKYTVFLSRFVICNSINVSVYFACFLASYFFTNVNPKGNT